VTVLDQDVGDPNVWLSLAVPAHELLAASLAELQAQVDAFDDVYAPSVPING
jgi:hypothetical protein